MDSFLTNEFTRIRVAAVGEEGAPTAGQVAEEIRQALKNKFGAYPPNLNTTINSDNSIQITAANPENGMNLKITLQDMNAGKTPPPPFTPQPQSTPPQVPPGGVVPPQ